METITSRTNPLCTHFRKLASSRSYREKNGRMLSDSPKLLKEAELWGQTVTAVMYTEGWNCRPCPAPARVVQVTESVMRPSAPWRHPSAGWCSPAPWPPRTRRSGLEPGRYLLLDGVQDPGNVGTILRTADAFGWTVLLLLAAPTSITPRPSGPAWASTSAGPAMSAPLEQAASLVRTAAASVCHGLVEDTADVRDVV